MAGNRTQSRSSSRATLYLDQLFEDPAAYQSASARFLNTGPYGQDQITRVPEPASLLLFGAALLALASVGRRVGLTPGSLTGVIHGLKIWLGRPCEPGLARRLQPSHSARAMDLIGRVSNRVELVDLGKCVDNGLVLDRRRFSRLFSDSGSLQPVAKLVQRPEPAALSVLGVCLLSLAARVRVGNALAGLPAVNNDQQPSRARGSLRSSLIPANRQSDCRSPRVQRRASQPADRDVPMCRLPGWYVQDVTVLAEMYAPR